MTTFCTPKLTSVPAPARRPKIRRPNRHGVVLASSSTAASQFCAAPSGSCHAARLIRRLLARPTAWAARSFFLLLALSSAAQNRLIHAFLRARLGVELRPGQRPGSLGMKLNG
ncbi:hypothetical protein MY8738_002785 [Beauveria namnaoensis]